jgi:3-hydroxymyristoyl/3-hydroxydecanoyl-(acyl carrier protein) dehydratase
MLILLLLTQITSCIAPKNLTKRDAITHDFLAGLKPGKKYLFELKVGIKQIVRITQIKDDRFTGQVYAENSDGRKVWNDYSETFEVAKISIYKFNPYLSAAAVMTVVIGTATLIFMITLATGFAS